MALWLVMPLVLLTGCDTATVTKTDPPAVDLPEEEPLRETIDGVLESTLYGRTLNTRDNAAWQILHGVLAYGQRFEAVDQGRRVRVVDWLLRGGNLRGWNVVPHTMGLQSIMAEGTKAGEGHPDQWLAVLSQCGLPPDTPLVVGGAPYTLEAMIRYAQWDLFEGKEMSWTLIALSAYLSPEAKWTARDGTEWSLERIVSEEARAALGEGACGGTHRLIGMSMALGRYREHAPHAELRGGWLEADEKIREAIDAAEKHCQADGGFSMNYFERPGRVPNLATQFQSTGHTLEFLALALPEDELGSDWVERGTLDLCRRLARVGRLDLDCGYLYHAIHGLAVYRQRRFGPKTYPPQAE